MLGSHPLSGVDPGDQNEKESNMKFEIRELREGDLAYLSWNLRAADVMEIHALRGTFDPLGPLQDSANQSTDTSVFVGMDGKPFMIVGMAPQGDSGIIWGVATPEVKKYRRVFLRASQDTIRGWFEKYPQCETLFNFTYAANVVHHNWLRMVGAKLLSEVPLGPEGKPFKPFVIDRETACAQ